MSNVFDNLIAKLLKEINAPVNLIFEDEESSEPMEESIFADLKDIEGKMHTFYKNPTAKELVDINKINRGDHEYALIRGTFDTKSGDAYAWPEEAGIHSEVKRKLGIPYYAVDFYINRNFYILFQNEDLGSDAIDYIVNSKWASSVGLKYRK